jgi:hypothetical protein
LDGNGKGPLSAELKSQPADLTILAKRNDGVFPVNAIYEVIDGRKSVKAHDTREMPIWGFRASPQSLKPGATKTTTETAPQRHILPKHLRNAVKHLSDGELDLMQAAILEEMKRRGRQPSGVETDLRTLRSRFNVRADLPMKRTSPKNQSQRRPVDIAEVSLTRGQVNAVRAAFKGWNHALTDCATVWISQSNVRTALASDKPKP